jgi:hypothetical protein
LGKINYYIRELLEITPDLFFSDLFQVFYCVFLVLYYQK